MTDLSFCPDEQMQTLLSLVDTEEAQGRAMLARLMREWPQDARLHFLEGSLRAAARDYAEGARAMRRAIDIAPDFTLARFQLGFLQLTNGEPIAAQESWGPLFGLAKSSFLRIFAEGLCHMIRDEFAQAIDLLEQGIVLNQDVPPLNRDMDLILTELRALREGQAGASDDRGEPLSAAQLLLQQSSFKSTRH